MRRPQFSLKSLLWLMVVVAGFLGGMAIQRRLDQPTKSLHSVKFDGKGGMIVTEKLETRDGTAWYRSWEESELSLIQ